MSENQLPEIPQEIRMEKFTLPAYWASTLINGDSSGLSDEEEREINEWLEDNPQCQSCIDVGEEIIETSRHDASHNLFTNCAIFTFIMERE